MLEGEDDVVSKNYVVVAISECAPDSTDRCRRTQRGLMMESTNSESLFRIEKLSTEAEYILN